MKILCCETGLHALDNEVDGVAQPTARLPYTSPQLTVHGRFQRVTLAVSGDGDAEDCSIAPFCPD